MRMAYSLIKGRFYYGSSDNDYFTFEGFVDDWNGGGTFAAGEIIRPGDTKGWEYAWKSSINSYVAIDSAENFAGSVYDHPSFDFKYLVVGSYFDSESGLTFEPYEPIYATSAWSFDDFSGEIFFDGVAYKFDSGTSVNPAAVEQQPTPEPSPDPIPNADSFFDWGVFTLNENHFLEAEVSSGDVYDIHFTVSGSPTMYAYFDLYEFTDDLDLALYKYNRGLNEYERISSSEEEGIDEETIFKGLAPGDYILEVSHFEDLDASDSSSDFTIGFDSKTYYENALIPDDSLFSSQWHLINTGQARGTDNEDIMAPEAWSIRSASPDVVVAVIDAGMQLDHPDLDNNLWVNFDEIIGNGIDDDGNGIVMRDMVGTLQPIQISRLLMIMAHMQQASLVLKVIMELAQLE